MVNSALPDPHPEHGARTQHAVYMFQSARPGVNEIGVDFDANSSVDPFESAMAAAGEARATTGQAIYIRVEERAQYADGYRETRTRHEWRRNDDGAWLAI